MRAITKYITAACLVTCAGGAHAETDAHGPAQAQTDSRNRANASQAEPAALSKQLWDWYGEASALHDAGKLSEAWALYQRVWSHRKTYDVATSLGGVCLQRGEFAAAAHYYRLALDGMVPTESPRFIERVQQAYETARARVAELKVTVAPIDGKAVAPVTIIDQRIDLTLEAPIFLEEGELTLEARTPEYDPVVLQVVAKPGATVEWKIDFDEDAGSRRVGPSEQRQVTTRHPWIVLPIGGLVTAGLAYGSWRNAARGEETFDAVSALQLQPGDCGGVDISGACERAVDLRRQGRDADRRAWWFGSGALLAAATTGVVYWLWETQVPVSVGFDPALNWGEIRWTHDF